MPSQSAPDLALPRVAIKFCTQCKWNLRAAYFAQELLSTFSTTIGEVALIPATGGVFTVTLTYVPELKGDDAQSGDVQAQTILLWDWQAERAFPGELYISLTLILILRSDEPFLVIIMFSPPACWGSKPRN
jgi:selT/selW/selH-like putative selenoprotein